MSTAAGITCRRLAQDQTNQNSGVDKGGAALQGPPIIEELLEADNC